MQKLTLQDIQKLAVEEYRHKQWWKKVSNIVEKGAVIIGAIAFAVFIAFGGPHFQQPDIGGILAAFFMMIVGAAIVGVIGLVVLLIPSVIFIRPQKTISLPLQQQIVKDYINVLIENGNKNIASYKKQQEKIERDIEDTGEKVKHYEALRAEYNKE